MTYVLLIVAVFVFLVWLGRRSAAARADWRTPAAILGLAVLVAGTAAVLRGAYLAGLALLALGVGVAASARRTRAPRAEAPEPQRRMSLAEARAVLGVDAHASAEEIQAAYLRLMRAVHPDRGGTSGLASQLNAARDRLLERR